MNSLELVLCGSSGAIISIFVQFGKSLTKIRLSITTIFSHIKDESGTILYFVFFVVVGGALAYFLLPLNQSAETVHYAAFYIGFSSESILSSLKTNLLRSKVQDIQKKKLRKFQKA